MVAEHDDFPVPGKLGGARGNLAHGNPQRAFDGRDFPLELFADVEEDGFFPPAAPGGLEGIDLEFRPRTQNPSRMLVTSDWANRPASASIATFSRSEKFAAETFAAATS